jgi:hypothetical protein
MNANRRLVCRHGDPSPLPYDWSAPAAEGLGRSDKSLRFVVVQVLPGALLSTRRPAIA